MKYLPLCFFFYIAGAAAQQPEMAPGPKSFQGRCAVCHGGDGAGSERGPGIIAYIATNPDTQIAATIRRGVRAMPAHDIADPEMKDLLAFLHTLRPAGTGAQGLPEPKVVAAKLTSGVSLNGIVRNETNFDMQLETADGKIHLLAKEGDIWRERSLLPKMDWTSYNGGYTGNRYSPLEQINTANVKQLAPKWVFPIPGAPRLEATPVVVEGIMYVTASNEAYALDATTGRRIWQYRQPRTTGILGEAAGGAQRGVAVSGDRVFMVTDSARLLSLNRWNGQKVWDVQMGDYQKDNASATVAPLVVGDLVVVGVAGGEEGVRGFVDAYKVSTGERVWRFWTIPKRGEKLAETWVGDALEHGCGASWMTGSYDPDLDLIYWGIGNPCPDYNGDQRIGDNLYTDSVVALDAKTGELRWYYQFTPHDTHDWDADEPILLIDEPWQGRPRKLLVQANRNGFFFVLDRTNGELLLATPFVKVNWASGYGKDGRPILVPDFNESSYEGTLTCPRAGANWPSASYSPIVKLFFVTAAETCAIIKKVAGPFEVGNRYFNGSATGVPGGRGYIRALDIQTGNKVWEYAPAGTGGGSSGTLATAGELVFIGESSGLFTALDARNGKPLWNFPANQAWRASPMTYMVGGKQFVVLAGPGGFFAFGLPD
jgi:alcohol dehydrogenase (cytochrome c)